MEIILYFLMFFVGYVGVVVSLRNQDVHWAFSAVITLLFIFLACSRMASDMELKDLWFYVYYFMHDYDSYFEIGYVALTRIVKFFFGHNSYALISVISIFVILLVVAASKICGYYLVDEKDTYMQMNNMSRSLILFYFVCFYWGCFFVWMTLRVGIATAMLYSATAFAINKRMLYCYLVALSAILFHSSCIVFILGISVLLFVKRMSVKQLYIWFFIVLLFRMVFGFVFPLGKLLLSIVLNFDIFAHYFEYIIGADPNSTAGVSLQDLLYFLFGFLMLKGNLSNQTYNRSVIIYYVGLTIGVIFQGSAVSMRLQWLFFAMVIFPLYYFVLDKSFSVRTKLMVVFGYAVLEQIMAIRQFGWYILV